MGDWATDWRIATVDVLHEPLPGDRDKPVHQQRRRAVLVWQCRQTTDGDTACLVIHARAAQPRGYDLTWPDGTYFGHVRATETGWIACNQTLISEPTIPTRNAAVGLLLSDF